ncbi:hypothetical protein ARAM_001262 [Aspergillus rambellii]|uniref:RING-type domain-containing protein n=1 Tax=Aspergillus rambellii TaxID=308745 RepID=A0A0F8UNS8_9EURO|nr:hypothetical protein ARAM_001262 [Aspergillus rambellii]
MDSPITVSSYDSDTPSDYYHLQHPEFPWRINAQLDGSAPNLNIATTPHRPSKRRRLHDLNDTNLNPASIDSSASLGPNSTSSPPRLPTQIEHSAQNHIASGSDTSGILLSQILEIFPDIRLSHVKELITRHQNTLSRHSEHAIVHPQGSQMQWIKDAVLEEILQQQSYPKQEKSKRQKEDDGDEYEKWANDTSHLENAAYSQQATAMLAKEFPSIPMHHIRKVIGEKKHLYVSYLALFAEDNNLDRSQGPFERLKKKRPSTNGKRKRSASVEEGFVPDELAWEMNAAKRKGEKMAAALQMEKDKEIAEKLNEEEHIQTGNLIECQCCYIEAPANRCLPCDGDTIHFFCFTCLRKSAETQIGLMKYTLQCFDVSGCQAKFSRYQLTEALGPSIMERLDSLQQQDEIRKACLEGLVDCPFCSFKAVCPPVEEDREFRCTNPTCEVVSCRLCKERSHVPLTCEESRKEKGISGRHEVEEAMSKAMIRNCPKCQLNIVKEYGCNKMVCPRCHTAMCYLCKKDISTEMYNHFGQGPNICPRDDPTWDREQKEVQQAERAAIDKVLAANPEMTEAELRIQHPKDKASKYAYQAPYVLPGQVIHQPIPRAALAQEQLQLPPHDYLQNHYAQAAGIRPAVPQDRNPNPTPQGVNIHGYGGVTPMTTQLNAAPAAIHYNDININTNPPAPAPAPNHPPRNFVGADPDLLLRDPFTLAPLPVAAQGNQVHYAPGMLPPGGQLPF